MNLSQSDVRLIIVKIKTAAGILKKKTTDFTSRLRFFYFLFYLDDDFFYKVRILNLDFRQESFCLTDLLILTKSSSIDFLVVSSDLEFS